MTLNSKSLIYTGVTAFGSLAPLLVSAFLLFFSSGTGQQYYNLIGRGEVSIISISISITALYSLYMMRQNRNRKVFDWYDLTFLITSIFFLAGIILYSYAANQNGVDTTDQIRNKIHVEFNSKLTFFSIIFFIWACIATYLSKNHEDSFVALPNKRQDDQSNLASRIQDLDDE